LKDNLTIPHPVRDGEQIDDIWDLEMGHLKYQVEKLNIKCSYSQRERVLLLAAIRNNLAHMKPLETFQIIELEKQIKEGTICG
jgi:hypothetical protein